MRLEPKKSKIEHFLAKLGVIEVPVYFGTIVAPFEAGDDKSGIFPGKSRGHQNWPFNLCLGFGSILDLLQFDRKFEIW